MDESVGIFIDDKVKFVEHYFDGGKKVAFESVSMPNHYLEPDGNQKWVTVRENSNPMNIWAQWKIVPEDDSLERVKIESQRFPGKYLDADNSDYIAVKSKIKNWSWFRIIKYAATATCELDYYKNETFDEEEKEYIVKNGISWASPMAIEKQFQVSYSLFTVYSNCIFTYQERPLRLKYNLTDTRAIRLVNNAKG